MGNELGEFCTQHRDFAPILLRKTLLYALPCRTFLSLLLPRRHRRKPDCYSQAHQQGRSCPLGLQPSSIWRWERRAGVQAPQGGGGRQPWGCIRGLMLLLSLVFWSI